MRTLIYKNKYSILFNIDNELVYILGIDKTYLFELTYKSDYYQKDIYITLFGLHFCRSKVRNIIKTGKKTTRFSLNLLWPNWLHIY